MDIVGVVIYGVTSLLLCNLAFIICTNQTAAISDRLLFVGHGISVVKPGSRAKWPMVWRYDFHHKKVSADEKLWRVPEL